MVCLAVSAGMQNLKTTKEEDIHKETKQTRRKAEKTESRTAEQKERDEDATEEKKTKTKETEDDKKMDNNVGLRESGSEEYEEGERDE